MIIDETQYSAKLANGSVDKRRLGARAPSSSSDPYLDTLKQVKEAIVALTIAVKANAPVSESVGRSEVVSCLSKIEAKLEALKPKPPAKKKVKFTIHRDRRGVIQSVDAES